MMHLTIKRLEAPGSLEIRWGGEKVWDVEQLTPVVELGKAERS